MMRFRFSIFVSIFAAVFFFLFSGGTALAAPDDVFAENDKHLPWTYQETYALTSGYNEDYHLTANTRYLLDFAKRFPDGTPNQPATANQPVRAIGDGEVIQAVSIGDNDGLGKFVRVYHGDGFETRYDHLGSVSVSEEDIITRGTEIGRTGDTGFSLGIHIQVSLWQNGVLIPLEETEADERPVQGTNQNTGETPITSFVGKTDDFFLSDNIDREPSTPVLFPLEAIDCTRARLQWSAVARERGFKVFRNGVLISTRAANSTQFINLGLSDDTSYTYFIRAFNEWGERDSITRTIVTPSCTPSAPLEAPVLLSAIPTSCNATNLEWTDVSGETAYRVFRDFTLVEEVPGGTTTYTDTGTLPLTSYIYTVRAANATGSSPDSNAETVETPDCSFPETPVPPPASPVDDGEQSDGNTFGPSGAKRSGVMDDPVNSKTGNFFTNVADIRVKSPGIPAAVSRTYNSEDDRSGALGPGWQFSYDLRLFSTGSNRYAVKVEDGKEDYFERTGDIFTPVYLSTVSTLTLDEDSWIYETPEKTEYRFDIVGRLSEIRDRNENTMEFSYDDDGRLDFFTDSAGRRYEVLWTGNRITNVTDPSGRSIEYSYDLDGFLESVRNTRGNTWRYEYNELGKISRIQNPAGVSSAILQYNDEGKTEEITHADGGSVQFTYEPDRVIQEDEREGLITFIHDEEGRLAELKDQIDQSETYTYDDHDFVATYEDRRGNVTSFDYDDLGNVTNISRPNGYTQEVAYNDFSRPLTITDFTGTVQFEYDDRGNLTEKTDQLGNEMTFTYDSRGLPLIETDALGRVSHFEYDSSGNLTRFTNPLGNATTFSYDGISRMTSVTDANGEASSFAYDPEDNRTALIDPRGNSILFTYDANNNVTSRTNETGHVMEMTYTPMDRLGTRTDYEGNVTHFAYDLDQNLISETDGRGYVTSYEYDLAGRRISKTLPEGGVFQYEYDGNDNVTRMIDPNGNFTNFSYNATNALISAENASGSSMTYSRDSLDRISEIGDFNGNTRGFSYDALSRIASETNPLGGESMYVYDAVSNLISRTDPLGRETEYTFNAVDRVTSILDAEGGVIFVTYDAVSNILTVTDQNGNALSYAYDANNNILSVTDSEGSVTHFEYDPRNLVSAFTSPNGHTKEFEYDRNSRLIQKINGLGHSFMYSYDASGNLIQTEDEIEAETQYDFDGDRRLIRSRDPLSHEMRQSYDPAGNLLSVTDPRGNAMLYFYDGLNRIIQKIDALGNETTFTYDPNGNLISRTDPLGRLTAFTYNAANQKTSFTNGEGDLRSFAYNIAAEPISQTDFRGNPYHFTYDGLSRLISIEDPLSNETNFSYDGVSNLISRIDALGSETRYDYDRANRLVEITRPEDVNEMFTYDPSGNITTYIDGEHGEAVFSYDENDSLVSMTDPLGHETQFEYTPTLLRNRILDPNGHETRFDYDFDRNLTSITDPRGNTRQFFYDENHNLIREEDARGFDVAYEFDPLNRLITFTDEEGFSDEYEYDAVSSVIRKQNRRGFQTNYEYDNVDRLIQMTDAKGASDFYSYDSDGNLLSFTDRNGAPTTYAYDAVSNLTEEVDALGGITTYDYDALYRLTEKLNPKDQLDQFEYDRLSRLTKFIDAASFETTFQYNKRSERILARNPRGFEMLFEYDADGNLIQKTDPLGFSETYEYDSGHNLTRLTDRRGNSTTYTYDPRDQLSSETNALGFTREFSYDENENLTNMRDGRGNDWLYDYDPRNNLAAETKPEGQETSYFYDENENLVRQTLPKGSAHQFEYDPLDLLETEVDPLSHATRYEYDPVERLITKTDANGNQTAYEYDPLGRLTQVIDALGGATGYQYDPVDNLLTMTDARGFATVFDYDVLNRLVEERNPLENTWQYEYDPNSNLASRTDANGQATNYVYDPNDRLTEIHYPDATHNVSYSYDPNANLIGMLDRAGQSDFSYDAINRMTDQWDAKDHHLGFNYDENNNRTAVIYPNDKIFSYEYDKNNWQTSVTDWQNLSATFAYDDNGNLIEEIYPNDSRVTYVYDFDDRLTKKVNAARGEPFETYELAYDPIHNITEEKRTWSQKRERGPVESAENIITYAYDALSRLTEVSDTDGKIAEYGYDPVGNRIRERNNRNFELIRKGKGTFDSNFARFITFEYNSANQLTSDSLFDYEYDENGNRTLKQSRSTDEHDNYFYDFENRLIGFEHFEKSPKPLAYSYLYDGLGRRVEKAQKKLSGRPVSVLAMGQGQGYGQGGNPDPGPPADPGPPPNVGPPSDSGPPISPPGQGSEPPGNSGNAPGQMDGSPGNPEEGNRGNDKEVGNAQDHEPRGPAQPHQRGRGEERPAHPDRPDHPDKPGPEKDGSFKPTWYVYDQFSFDPLVEFRFPNKEIHLRRVQTVGSPISRLYSREIFSGETPDDPLEGEDPTQLGRYAYFYSDHRYDTSSILKHSGQSLHSYLYDEYGLMYDQNKKPRDASNFTNSHNLYTFSQKEFDPESSLSYFGARSYDAFSGTWTTQDIYRGRTFIPETLQRYGYVKNNPISLIDPYGYSWYGDFWEGTKSTVSAAGSFVAEKTTQAYEQVKSNLSAAGEILTENIDVGLQKISDVATFDTTFSTPSIRVFGREIIPESTIRLKNEADLRFQEGVFTAKSESLATLATNENTYGTTIATDVAVGFNKEQGIVAGGGFVAVARKNNQKIAEAGTFIGTESAAKSLGYESSYDYVAQRSAEIDQKAQLAMAETMKERNKRRYLASLFGVPPRTVDILPLNTFAGKFTLGTLQTGIGLLQTAFGTAEVTAGVAVATGGTATGIGAVPGILAGVGLGVLGTNNLIAGGTQTSTGIANIIQAFRGKDIVDFTYNPVHEAINDFIPEGKARTAAYVGYEVVDIFGGGFGIWKAGKISGMAEELAEAAKLKTGIAPNIIFKTGHVTQHISDLGLTVQKVEATIAAEVKAAIQGASQTGSFWGRVTIDGKIIEYRAFTLPDGTINIGTYYPLNP